MYQTVNRRVIQFIVEYGASIIFDRILHSCNENDDNQWHGVKSGIHAAKNAKDLPSY